MISDALSALSGAGGLLVVILGFGALILVHELGHFLAARWAGVRVHEFSIGFGPAIFSFRKGIGFRLGSSQREYAALLRKTHDVVRLSDDAPGVSATEYRLNLIPFGGYVKMLGQDDANPGATSDAPDSFNAKPVWVRMVIISGGVALNVLTAGILFVIVFMAGLRQPAPIIGGVAAGAPAAQAVPDGGGEPGLKPGDRVLSINGKPTPSFSHISVAAAMARPNQPMKIVVEREGAPERIAFTLRPEKRSGRGVEIGVIAAASDTIARFAASDEGVVRALLEEAGIAGVWSGMRLVEVDGRPARTFRDLDAAVRTSGGRPIPVAFEDEQGERVRGIITPAPQLHVSVRRVGDADPLPIEHLLGLAPPMGVALVSADRAEQAGLRAGDLLARVGAIEWPDRAQGIVEIGNHKNRTIELSIVRDGEYLRLSPPVNARGQIGFTVMPALRTPAIATRPAPATDSAGDPIAPAWPAEALDLQPGTRILTVNGAPVTTYADLREALRSATQAAINAATGASVLLEIRLPIGERYGEGPVETLSWEIPAVHVERLHALGWTNPLPASLFVPELVTLKAKTPVGAIRMGVIETHRIVTLTYLTLVRLFQGTVEVNQLRGPVGITHIGTQIIQDGLINLLFFLAVISVNLAVLNFLPLPIVDGGHMVFLAIEGLTGRPVSIAVQNLTALLGLALVGGLFVLITFNDIKNLINGL